MKSLNRESILGARDIKKIKVDVPEWGGSIYIAPLTVGQRDKMLSDLREGGEGDVALLRMLLFISTVQDAEGNLLFTKEDIPELENKSATAIDRIFNATEELAAVTEDSLGK